MRFRRVLWRVISRLLETGENRRSDFAVALYPLINAAAHARVRACTREEPDVSSAEKTLEMMPPGPGGLWIPIYSQSVNLVRSIGESIHDVSGSGSAIAWVTVSQPSGSGLHVG